MAANAPKSRPSVPNDRFIRSNRFIFPGRVCGTEPSVHEDNLCGKSETDRVTRKTCGGARCLCVTSGSTHLMPNREAPANETQRYNRQGDALVRMTPDQTTAFFKQTHDHCVCSHRITNYPPTNALAHRPFASFIDHPPPIAGLSCAPNSKPPFLNCTNNSPM